MNHFLRNKPLQYTCLALLFLISLAFKLSYIKIGAPYTTIDDFTLFNAGFLVWFGEAPPQRMYFESWIAGVISIATYISHLIQSGQIHQLGLNIIADAYRDFTQQPYGYVLNYRIVMLGFDLATAAIIYSFAKTIIGKEKHWAAIFATGLYLLSYNTIWCNLVARPDTVTAFFAALGVLFYYKSNFSGESKYFYFSAIALGCATGFKLHAAFFVIAISIDLFRIHGLKTALKHIIPFGIVAVFMFMVVAGSPLFDPLLYVKLRALNMKDDASPWLHWGDQFIALAKGTGWLIIPLIVALLFKQFAAKEWKPEQKIKSLLLICCAFVLFFCSIRQLRAYWMLPALPLFYVMASYFIAQLKNKYVAIGIAAASLLIFTSQCAFQIKDFSSANYAELQDWVKKNVAPSEAIYIVGYDTLFLPRNTICLQNNKKILEAEFAQSVNQGESFTLRHIRLWEENSELILIDLLNAHSNTGFNYYGSNDVPLTKLSQVMNLSEIKYLLVIPGFIPEESATEIEQLKSGFTRIATANAPGGKAGTGGLPYDIYARNP